YFFFFFSSRRRHTRWPRDWSSDVCSSDLVELAAEIRGAHVAGEEVDRLRRRQADVGGQVGIVRALHGRDVRTDRRVLLRQFQRRSEERRVGKGCRWKGWRGRWKKRKVVGG